MKKIALLLSVLLTALFLVSCDAPGVILLDSLLPPLTEESTGYTVTESIVVTNLLTEASVTFSTPAEMNTLHMQLEGVKCIRNKDKTGMKPSFMITFITADAATSLYILDEKNYLLDDEHYEAMRSGVDMYYLNGLFE